MFYYIEHVSFGFTFVKKYSILIFMKDTFTTEQIITCIKIYRKDLKNNTIKINDFLCIPNFNSGYYLCHAKFTVFYRAKDNSIKTFDEAINFPVKMEDLNDL